MIEGSRLAGAKVVVAVGGGIAAYKSATLVSNLVKDGCDVHVVMTRSSQQFIGPATFNALCNRPPVLDPFDPRFPLGPHIELANECKLLIVAPATARILASFANGLADDLLGTLYLNSECPVLVAPAMSTPMWEKPAVQRNLRQIIEDGVQVIGPIRDGLAVDVLAPVACQNQKRSSRNLSPF